MNLAEATIQASATEIVIVRKCPSCLESKPLSDFGINHLRKDGHNCYCKLCIRRMSAQSYQRTIIESRKRKARYGIKHKARLLAYSHSWYLKNKVRVTERIKAHYQRNREFYKAYSNAWSKANLDKRRLYHENWLAKGDNWLYARGRSGLQRALRRGGVSRGIRPATILEKHGMICHICKNAIVSRDQLHFDHVIPISRGGVHDENNLRPSHAKCNLSKGAKVTWT
jgi:5-methylcytosine-specific restriction endonuclease McrA